MISVSRISCPIGIRVMRRENLQLAARFRDAMKFRHEPENVGNVLYHVTADDLFKLAVVERIRKDSEIVNDVSMTSRIRIDTDRGNFVGPQSTSRMSLGRSVEVLAFINQFCRSVANSFPLMASAVGPARDTRWGHSVQAMFESTSSVRYVVMVKGRRSPSQGTL